MFVRRALPFAAAFLFASAAPAQENERPRRPFVALLFGGGAIDAHAVQTNAEVAALGNSFLGNIEVMVRAGWRTPIGLYPIVDVKGGFILGALDGSVKGTWGAMGGLQWSPWMDALRAPYLNVRGGVRGDAGYTHSTGAVGLGVELGRGQPFTTLEASLEPFSPWLFVVRVGAVF
jgi:hypothetical protein